MKRISSNGTYIYHLNADVNLPEFLSSVDKRKHLNRNPDLRRHIQLIQDFEMPDVCHEVKVSPDGRYAIAAGTYKPRVRCYELSETSMKYEQGMDYEIVKTCFLSPDFSKLVFLLEDRRLEFHVNGLRYFRMRVPVVASDMVFSSEQAELYIAGESKIHRLNLEHGRFMAPFDIHDECKRCCLNNEFNFLAVGTTWGHVQMWDPRARTMVAKCTIPATFRQPSVTAIDFDPEAPYRMAIGTSNGLVHIYDIRSSNPLISKDNGVHVIETMFIHDQQVATCDRRYLRIFNHTNGHQKLVVPSTKKINSMCIPQRGSGLIFVPTDSPKIHTYFIPDLGPAPTWCSYLDTIVEELKESVVWNDAYDGYRFVSRNELEELDLGKYLSTSFAHPYLMQNVKAFMSLNIYLPFLN
ncbi:hypothetical protein ACOME3_005487 [Neoechinorhynchus agilis]